MSYAAEPGGPELFANTVPSLDAVWSGRFAPGVDPRRFHLHASATVVPERSGDHLLTVISIGPAQVLLDGTVVLDTTGAPRGPAFFGFGTEEIEVSVPLVAGRSYQLAVEYHRPERLPLGGLRVGLQPPLGDDPLGDAAAAAAAADVAVVVVGTDEVEETEGHDRHTMTLGAGQDQLVRRVAGANPRTVVVVNSGSAVDMPWAAEVPAIVQLWFPGMAGGEALGEVLTGLAEPGGRLPFTVPVDLADAPCDISVADPPGHLRYTERLLVGHRWYLDNGRSPRWWFGAGEGYSHYEWGPAEAALSGEGGLVVRVPVSNTGRRDGREVVQVYLARPASAVERPPWVLGGFAKRRVAAGATEIVEVEVDPAALRHWDEERGWRVEPGPLQLGVARSSGDPGQVVTIELP
jgi:beta-glucosidase